MNLKIIRIPCHFRAFQKFPFPFKLKYFFNSHKASEGKGQETEATILHFAPNSSVFRLLFQDCVKQNADFNTCTYVGILDFCLRSYVCHRKP